MTGGMRSVERREVGRLLLGFRPEPLTEVIARGTTADMPWRILVFEHVFV